VTMLRYLISYTLVTLLYVNHGNTGGNWVDWCDTDKPMIDQATTEKAEFMDDDHGLMRVDVGSTCAKGSMSRRVAFVDSKKSDLI